MRSERTNPFSRRALVPVLLGALSVAACAPAAQRDQPPVIDMSGVGASGATGGAGSMQSDTMRRVIDQAMQDAARRSGRDASTLKLLAAEAVTWPDGSIGCPEPGRAYTQALVPGYRVRIDAGGEVLEYHASRVGVPFLCPAGRLSAPATTDPRT